MTPAEIVQALYEGKTLNDESGREYKFDGVQMRVKEDNKFLPRSVDVAYILSMPQKFKEVE